MRRWRRHDPSRGTPGNTAAAAIADAVGLPTGLDGTSGRIWDPRRLLEHMTRDKKVAAGRVVFVLVRGIGEAFVGDDVDPAEVEALLTGAIAA